MKIRFWGTRGTIPTPLPDRMKYGGNTTCIEVRTDAGEIFLLDGGTGIYQAGLDLMKSLPVSCNVFITHTHWDHIQGLPLFVPFFVPGNSVKIFGSFDPVYQKTLQDILAGQMEYCYFPVRESELKADLDYQDMQDSKTVEIGSAKVTPVLMNHPVLCFGYRIDADGQSMFFTGDHEPPPNIYDPADDEYEEYQELLEMKNESIYRHLQDLDVLITDATYTDEEYKTKEGWGHGTFRTCFEMARAVKAKKVVFTHHEPTRSDDAVDQIAASMKDMQTEDGPDIVFAQEGMVIAPGE
jgi:phosphoribosyl 1,2-cyclic phosphodiesterase